MATGSEKPFPENYLFKYGPVFIYIIILSILVDDLLELGFLSELQWQHLVLLGGLILIPFIREIDRIFIPNVGGVEMGRTKEWKETMQDLLEDTRSEDTVQSELEEEEETDEEDEENETEEAGETDEVDETEEADEADEKEVQQPETGLDERIDYKKRDALGGNIDEIINEIYSLADENPRLAIAKLGMELEHGIRHLLYAKGEIPHMHYHQMLEQLRNNPEIDNRFINIAMEIRQARNEAVHSAEFNPKNTAGLIDVGIDMLKYINKNTKTGKIPEGDPRGQTN